MKRGSDLVLVRASKVLVRELKDERGDLKPIDWDEIERELREGTR